MFFRSGGYKISALDVERVLLSHDGVVDAAVVGLDDQEWGQVVAAVVVVKDNVTQEEVRSYSCYN